jgi:uncharacterized protein YndB with AHSA1/START domain
MHLDPSIGINETAPALTRQERRIAATPQRVFDLLADVDQWPSWQGAVSKVSVESPVRTGTTFRWRSGVPITSTITVLEPARAIAWTGRAVGTRAIHTWSLTPVDGGALVRTEESMTGWLPRLLPRTIGRTLDRGVTAVLDALEAAVR